MATTDAQVNNFYDVIDSSSAEGKKLYQKETESLPNDQKYNGDDKGIIKFFERVERKGEDFGWNAIARNIGNKNLDIFSTPGKWTAEDCKKHCDPK